MWLGSPGSPPMTADCPGPTCVAFRKSCYSPVHQDRMNHPGIAFSTASCVAQQSCLCSENNQKKKKKLKKFMPSQRLPPDIWHAAQGNRVLPLPIPQHRDQQSHGDKSAPSDAAVYPQKVLHHSFLGGDPRWSTSPSSSCAMPSCGKTMHVMHTL